MRHLRSLSAAVCHPIVGATLGAVVGPVGVVGAAQSGAISIVWACVALKVGCVESTTITVKSNVPAAVGVPVIAPVAGSSVRPGGRPPTLPTR